MSNESLRKAYLEFSLLSLLTKIIITLVIEAILYASAGMFKGPHSTKIHTSVQQQKCGPQHGVVPV